MLMRMGLGALNTFVASLLWRLGFECLNIRSDWAVVGGFCLIVGTVLYFVWSTAVIFPILPRLVRTLFINK